MVALLPVDESAARIERVPQAIYRVMLTDHDGWSYTVNEAVSFDQFVSERAAQRKRLKRTLRSFRRGEAVRKAGCQV